MGRRTGGTLRGFVVLVAVLLGFAGALAGCSSGSGSPPLGNGEIPPPLSQPCTSDVECEPFGLKCDPLRGCLACVFDAHCADGERCTAEGCQLPSTCRSDTECAAVDNSPHCDPVISECVACRYESDCPTSSHCKERSCVPYTACVNTRDCAAGTICDRDAGECAECLANGDCGETEVCVAKKCVPKCDSDKDCIERNQLCNTQGYCADCVEQEDCPAIYYCSNDLCKLDTCSAGSTECAAGGIQVCNALGSDYDLVPCPSATSCTKLDGVASCTPWLCSPGTLDCDPLGQEVTRCADDGLSLATQTDCVENGGLCYLGQCLPQVCEPGALFCQGQEARECTANGTNSVVLASCGFGNYCVEGSASCLQQACTPGAKQCDGDVITECDEIGSAYVDSGVDCSEDDEKCYLGGCKPSLCDAPYCQNGNGWSCMENGTRSELVDACTGAEYCLDGGCFAKQCTPGNPVCVGSEATTCADDGSAPLAGEGTDCADSDQGCLNGLCQPIICVAGEYYCSGGNPQLCNSTGTGALRQADTCLATEYCKAGSSICQTDVCVAGAKLCAANVATTCAADGAGPAAGGTDCAATGKVCEAGTCLPKVCNANEYFCDAGNVARCGATGATSTKYDTCLAGEFCEAGAPLCKPDVCVAGAATCNGDKLSTCAADGSGAANAGTACGAGKICESAVCKDVICTVDALSCTTNDVSKCVAKGTAWTVTQVCGVPNYCNEASVPIACAPDVCEPAAKTCNGEQLATCSADGGHYATTTTNCATTGKVCTLAGTCLATAVETVGEATGTSSAASAYLEGNVYRVDRARTLTLIEQYATVSGTSVFTWVVYEGQAAGAFPPYTFTTKVAEVTTASSGSAVFHSSGALSVQLQAGKYYFIGVLIQGAFTRFYEPTYLQEYVSFGQLVDSYSASGSTLLASYTDQVTSGTRYYQRLTTAAAQ